MSNEIEHVEGYRVERVEPEWVERYKELERRLHPLVPQWCDCDEDTGFRCYPEDGECSCGVHKHHVHGNCGHITQVG